MLQFDELLPLADLKEVLVFLLLVPFFFKDHLLLAETVRTDGRFGFTGTEHIHCDDLLRSGWLNSSLEEL